MTIQWEYMYMDFDGSPDPGLTSFQDKINSINEPKTIFLWLPDGSVQMVQNVSVVDYRQQILKILNDLGLNGWEAFNLKEENLRIHWTLKRQKI